MHIKRAKLKKCLVQVIDFLENSFGSGRIRNGGNIWPVIRLYIPDEFGNQKCL
jgi:hypothetical protein